MSSFNINNATMGINIVPSGTNQTISISSDNKVGIGISSPVYQLDVVGTGNFSNDLISAKISVTDTITQKINNRICDGRLTLESGVAISITDQIDKDTIFFTPYNGNAIGLYNGSNWELLHFSETSLSLGTLTSNTNYDVFAYNNSGTLGLEIGPAWTDDTTRSTNIVLQDGVYVKASDPTRRYLGTFRTTSTTTTEDSETRRFLWNMYNRTRKNLTMIKTTATYTYTTIAWRPWQNSIEDGVSRFYYVIGLFDGDHITSTVTSQVRTTGGSPSVNFSIDQTSEYSPAFSDAEGRVSSLINAGTNSHRQMASISNGNILCTQGYHFITGVERGATTATFQSHALVMTIKN